LSIRFLADEDVDANPLRGLQRREPAIDILDVKTSGLRETADPELLELAAQQCFSLSFLIVARHAPYRKRGEYHGNRGEHRGVNEWDARVRSPDGGQSDLIQMVSRR
jgi:hypothetical protein